MLKLKDVIGFAVEKLPDRYRKHPWKLTSHGTDVLEDADALNAYLAAYGNLHRKKLKKVLCHVDFAKMSKEGYYIVDWGAGQGIGTLSLIEEIRGCYDGSDNMSDPVHSLRGVLLVEKSQCARERAELFVSAAMKCDGWSNIGTWSVRGVDWDMEQIDLMLSRLPFGANVVHVFSNILDIVDVQKDFERIKSVIGDCHDLYQHDGMTYVVAVGPQKNNWSSKGCQLHEFMELLIGDCWVKVTDCEFKIGLSKSIGFVLCRRSQLAEEFVDWQIERDWMKKHGI